MLKRKKHIRPMLGNFYLNNNLNLIYHPLDQFEMIVSFFHGSGIAMPVGTMLTNKNVKETDNNSTRQDLDKFELEKSTKRVGLSNVLLFTLAMINFMILTYFYLKQDISFSATGGLPIPETIHGYHIFLALIVFTIYQLTEYVKNFSMGTEKEKKKALQTLAVINLFTLPINLPLIGGFIAYHKGNEIICNNLFLGTFRRVLHENEREKLYNETVKNFLEKIEWGFYPHSQNIKDQLKIGASQSTKSMLEKYDAGSDFATK